MKLIGKNHIIKTVDDAVFVSFLMCGVGEESILNCANTYDISFDTVVKMLLKQAYTRGYEKARSETCKNITGFLNKIEISSRFNCLEESDVSLAKETLNRLNKCTL